MKNGMWSLAVVVLCGVFAAGTALGQEGEGRARGRQERGQKQRQMGERHEQGAMQGEQMGPRGAMRGLELTPEQREQIKAIHEKYAEQTQAARETLRQKHEALRKITRQLPVDEGAIRSAANHFGNAAGDFSLLVAHRHEEVRAILTPEQQEKFDAFAEELPAPGRGPRGGPRNMNDDEGIPEL